MKTVLNVKVDKEIKEKAQRMTKEMGFPLSIVVNTMLRDFTMSGEFTFRYEPTLKPELVKELKSAHDDYKKGKNITPIRSVSDFKKFIKAA